MHFVMKSFAIFVVYVPVLSQDWKRHKAECAAAADAASSSAAAGSGSSSNPSVVIKLVEQSGFGPGVGMVVSTLADSSAAGWMFIRECNQCSSDAACARMPGQQHYAGSLGATCSSSSTELFGAAVRWLACAPSACTLHMLKSMHHAPYSIHQSWAHRNTKFDVFNLLCLQMPFNKPVKHMMHRHQTLVLGTLAY
jgi:hypothetical protein